jgi:hypothetical protein
MNRLFSIAFFALACGCLFYVAKIFLEAGADGYSGDAVLPLGLCVIAAGALVCSYRLGTADVRQAEQARCE